MPDSSGAAAAHAEQSKHAWRNNGVVYRELTLRQFIESGRLEEDVAREKSDGLECDSTAAGRPGATGKPSVSEIGVSSSKSISTTSISAALTPVDPQVAAQHFRKYQTRCAADRASALFDAHARREWMRRLYHPVEAEKTKVVEDARRRRACQRFVCSIVERGLPTLDRLPDAELVAARGGAGTPGASNKAGKVASPSVSSVSPAQPATACGNSGESIAAEVADDVANNTLEPKDAAITAAEPSESHSAKEPDNETITSSSESRFQVGDVEVDFGASSEEDDDDPPGADESDDDDFGIDAYDGQETNDKGSADASRQVEQLKGSGARRCGRVQTVRHMPAILRCQLHERIPRQAFVDTVLNAVGFVVTQ